tara:strand:+ start:4314 stop:4469 length:156 start_codon:yes stop_codon:yes gene_type:complete
LNIKNGLDAIDPDEETEDDPSIVTPTLGIEEIGFSLIALKPSIISSYLLKL